MSFMEELLELAIAEDIGDGDHTSEACIPEDATGQAQLLVKEKGILAGIDVARAVFDKIDSNLEMDVRCNDGASVAPGDMAFVVSGSSKSILRAERLALNLMQRMCGIATHTRKIAELIAPYGTKVLDTRKTTPALREIEKAAVRIGGGVNHRMGLFDMIMIKDNHIDFAGGVREAIDRTKKYLNKIEKALQIEIEARDLEELDEILNVGGIDRIMLDNFSYEDLKTAVKRIDGTCETEASGGITIETAEAYAMCGVDYISVGALTHTVKNFDLSLKAI